MNDTVRHSPGCERHAAEPAQLEHRAGDGRLVVADVELDDLVARALAGVLDVDADGDLAADGGDLVAIDPQPVDPERRVRAGRSPNGQSGVTGPST